MNEQICIKMHYVKNRLRLLKSLMNK